MNRHNLKFKVFDKENRIFGYWPNDDGLVAIKDYRGMENVYELSYICQNRKKYEILQFSGLYAKNDKAEVYDDDICLIKVNFSNPDADKANYKTFLAHIYYDDEMFVWFWQVPKDNVSSMFCEHELDVLEVVGSHIDNPNLLKGTW